MRLVTTSLSRFQILPSEVTRPLKQLGTAPPASRRCFKFLCPHPEFGIKDLGVSYYGLLRSSPMWISATAAVLLSEATLAVPALLVDLADPRIVSVWSPSTVRRLP